MTRMTRTRWPGVDEDKVEAPDGEGTGIDLRDRLRFAAGSLAADFGGELTIDLAEELVFSSAEGLLVAASVTDFVPILAERRARQVVRAGATAHAAVPAPPAGPPRPAQLATAPTPPVPSPPAAAVAPLFAVPESELTRLRGEVERAQLRVAEWRAQLTRR
ncbi:MAG TPA: hypothetical protein VKL22_08110 [Actinomycetota bacterium]|nr:hypothetical protein [Actinomycetota bacterium]